jgi:hypothetical protein
MQPHYSGEARMKYIPKTNDTLVLRTDFSDEAAWESISAAILEPQGDFRAYVELVSDQEFDGVTAERLLSLFPEDPKRTFIFVVDRMALVHPDHPILVVDLYTEPGQTFRVIPSAMWGVENNLSICNMDFGEFVDAADQDGIFRGIPMN